MTKKWMERQQMEHKKKLVKKLNILRHFQIVRKKKKTILFARQTQLSWQLLLKMITAT